MFTLPVDDGCSRALKARIRLQTGSQGRQIERFGDKPVQMTEVKTLVRELVTRAHIGDADVEYAIA